MSGKWVEACLRCSCLIILLLFWLVGASQTRKPGSDIPNPELDQLLKENQKSLGNNFVVMVWKDSLVYQKQMEKEIGDFNARTQAAAPAISPWLTAALVMSFVDEGKLTLDDKVSTYIPIFAKYMKSYITLRNCLSLTTGIQADASLKLLPKTKYQSLEDEVNVYASKREIETNPGTQIFYSQIGPDLAGRVLEIVSKKAFDRLMQERIFRPLKMRGSSFATDDGTAVDPNGGLKTTPNDVMNFLVMMLNKGMFQGKRVLSEKAVEEMEKIQFAQVPVKFVPKEAVGWHTALGVWVADAAGKSNTVGSLNLGGTWPIIDRCGNYAALIFVKNAEEPKKEIYQHFKETIDRQWGGACPGR